MKEFMEKLFSNQYFGVCLFAVIGILALLFVIVLIMALRDAKKNKKALELTEETDKAEKMADVAFASVNDAPIKVEVSPIEEEKKEDVVEFKTTTNDTFEDVKVEAPTEFIENDKKSAFPDLDISKPEMESFKEAEENITSNDEEDKKEEKVDEPILKPQQPEQFSSIYVTPGAIPEKEEVSKSEENVIPDLSDIPMPTPIKVVSSTSIVDASSKEVNGATSEDVTKSSEEYTLK